MTCENCKKLYDHIWNLSIEPSNRASHEDSLTRCLNGVRELWFFKSIKIGAGPLRQGNYGAAVRLGTKLWRYCIQIHITDNIHPNHDIIYVFSSDFKKKETAKCRCFVKCIKYLKRIYINQDHFLTCGTAVDVMNKLRCVNVNNLF